MVAPCHESWDNMSGGDDIRFCGRCRQNVYNLSEMNETQVRELVQGPACVRFFARGDGTVITKECPSMLEAARRRMVAMAAGVLPLAAAFWGGVAWLRGVVHGGDSVVMGGIQPVEPPPVRPVPREDLMGVPRPTMGDPAPLMGKPAPPPRKKKRRAARGEPLMGRRPPTPLVK